jgi:homoserine kinase
VPGFLDILAAATSTGAAGVFLSGAGPSVLALHDRAVAGLGLRIADAMRVTAATFGVEGRRMILDIREQGAEVARLPEDPASVGPPA